VDSPWTEQEYDYHGVAWYHLSLAVPDDLRAEMRLQLLFGAIDGYAQAFVDGEKVAEERVSPRVMSHRPFFAPLPESIGPGQCCEVAVRVVKDSGGAGLWKPVCLVEKI